MATVWSSNGYPAANDFQYWSAQQEFASDRVQIIAPPAEVGGGPQSRSAIGRFRIEAADDEPFGNPNVQRAEVFASGTTFFPNNSCQGTELWVAWENYFGNPSVVADTNAFRPTQGTDGNHFAQFHSNAPGPGLAPLIWFVNTNPGSSASVWRFGCWSRGGLYAGSPTPLIKHDIAAFSYGWNEFKCYIFWGQENGRLKVWHRGPGASVYTLGVDYTGPVGYVPGTGSAQCNYFKRGCYRTKSSVNSTTFAAGDRMGTTEADVDAEAGGGSGGGSGATPAANTRERRFGKETVGSGRNGFSLNNKRAAKFATGLDTDEEADVHDLHVFVEGADGSGSTQPITLGIWADDGGSGAPGTKFGESQEFTVAGNAAGTWQKITLASPIRVTGANAWLGAGSGTPSNRVNYATDVVTNGLAFNADTYDGSAPRLSDPFGASSLTGIDMSICADYDVEEGSSGGGGDTTAPVLQSARVEANLLTLAYDEPLNTSSEPQTGDYTVLVNGQSRSVILVDVAGSQVQLVISPSANAGDAVGISYTRASGREVEDLAGNLAANLTDQVVTNETDQEGIPARLINVARATSGDRVVGGEKGAATGGGL